MRGPRARVGIAAAAALLACAGCGFKGPLYLPARNATVVTHPAQGAQGAQGAQSPGQTQSPAAKRKSKTPPPGSLQQNPSQQNPSQQNPPPQSPPAPPPPSAQ